MRFFNVLFSIFAFSIISIPAVAQDESYEAIDKHNTVAEDIGHFFIANFDSVELVVGKRLEDDILGNAQWATREKLDNNVEGLITKISNNETTIVEFKLDENLPLEEAKGGYAKYKAALLKELESLLEGEYELTEDEESFGYAFEANSEIRPTGSMEGVVFLPTIYMELKTNYKDGFNILLSVWFQKGFEE